ncbi:MAG: DUF3352 domain-containing protein [Anaerolineaceae bacterium]
MSYQPNYPNYYQQAPVPPPPPPAPAPENPNKKRNLIITIVVVAVVLICCCALAVVLLVWDPFGFGLLSMLSGGSDAAAAMVPANSEVYISANLLNLTPEKLNRVIQPFSDVLDEVDVKDSESALKEIDKQLDDTFGITLTDDVMPWVGKSVGLSMYDLEMDSYGSVEDSKMVLAIQARNKKAADEFLVKFVKGIEDNNDVSFDESDYEGTIIYSVSEDYFELALCRYKGFVLISSDEGTMKDTIDLKKADSMAKNADFKAMMSNLPKDRAVTVFINSTDLVEALTDSISYGTGSAVTSTLDSWKGSALSMAIVDAGLQIDSVAAYDTENIDEDMKVMLEESGLESKAVSMLPEDAIAFVSGTRLDLTWKAISVNLAGMGDEIGYEEAMKEFEDMAGFNLDSDLMAHLDGDYAICVFPSNEGMLSDNAGVDLGFAALIGTSQQDAVTESLDKLADTLEEDAYMTVDSSSFGDGQIYELSDLGGALAIRDSYLGLGSSANVMEDVYDKKSSIKDNPRYQEMLKSVPSGMAPVLFIDVAGGIDILDEIIPYGVDEVTQNALKPIQYLVMSGSPMKNGLTRSSILVAIEPVE